MVSIKLVALAVAAALVVSVGGLLVWLWRSVDVLGTVLEAVGGAGGRAKRRLIGPDPSNVPRRVVTAVILLSVALALAGAFMAARGMVETGTSALPIMGPFLELATSVWAYVAMLAWLTRRIIFYRDRRKAEIAANVTGYLERSVRRLSYEARDVADGATRVIATSEDEPEAIEARILEALETGEDDTISLNPEAFKEAFQSGGEESDELTERRAELEERFTELTSRADDLEAELDAGLDDVLGSEANLLDPEVLRKERVSLADLLDAEASEALEGLEDVEAERESVVEEAREVSDELAWLSEHSGLRLEFRLGEAERDARALADALEFDVSGEVEVSDEWREEWKLTKLDLASTLDFDEILWRVGVPAGFVVALLLLAGELWVSPILYPAILAAGLLVGVLNYLRVARKRSKKLESVRETREGVTYNDLAVLVKEVEVPETTVCYGALAGRKYAHDDREEFAEELSHRAYELVQGVPVSPSIMEKQATQLETLSPDLHGFRDAERERIMKWLLERVQSTRHGLIPKAKLIEDCIEYELKERRIGPGRSGSGFDPNLVRECYRGLVPEALVEQEIEPPEDGESDSVTAVRLRDDPLPPEYAEIRAAFTTQFQNYANWTPLYELPDVSDQLEEEPVYADRLGYRGGTS